jgi:hypothetical protein
VQICYRLRYLSRLTVIATYQPLKVTTGSVSANKYASNLLLYTIWFLSTSDPTCRMTEHCYDKIWTLVPSTLMFREVWKPITVERTFFQNCCEGWFLLFSTKHYQTFCLNSRKNTSEYMNKYSLNISEQGKKGLWKYEQPTGNLKYEVGGGGQDWLLNLHF